MKNTLNILSRKLDLGATPIFEDVPGAPVKIGSLVKVLAVEMDCSDQEEYDDLYGWAIGLTGRVVYLEYSCGSGQTYPEDPMIGVRFPDGRVAEYWAEELNEVEKKGV